MLALPNFVCFELTLLAFVAQVSSHTRTLSHSVTTGPEMVFFWFCSLVFWLLFLCFFLACSFFWCVCSSLSLSPLSSISRLVELNLCSSLFFFLFFFLLPLLLGLLCCISLSWFVFVFVCASAWSLSACCHSSRMF
ncbi:hypothetical protein DFJ73DRAFT_852563 [Zopfochytrium polystomum]|nr:hypothetical protein DFJ73DRAFT_852563 [Zopfochytrium polystomum]